MDARIKSAHDGGEQRFNSSGLRRQSVVRDFGSTGGPSEGSIKGVRNDIET
jgi:hypothetical protein